MAGGGSWLGRAREKGVGVFIGLGACRGGCSVASWHTGAKEWARDGGDVRRGRRPMAKGGAHRGESAVAAWQRPKPPRRRHGP
jgi:hypothetical protein